jgi:hypothetical protein
MRARHQLSALSFDLTRLHPRTVTSFYSNLVTRPTGRAVRMGLERQLLEAAAGAACLSILDFSQVRVMDYSCADEVVAKLLMKYAAPDRPVDAYFLARGLQDHHLEAVEAVLDRHGLLLVAEEAEGDARLLGPSTPVELDCWSMLIRRGRALSQELATESGVGHETLERVVDRFLTLRVALPLAGRMICAVPVLNGLTRDASPPEGPSL